MSITTVGEILLKIQGHDFTLKGLINEAINVWYHIQPDDPKANSLDSLEKTAQDFATAFGVDQTDFWEKLKKKLGDLEGNSTDLRNVVEKLLSTTEIVITDVGINTNDPVMYQVGFFVKLEQMKLGSVEITGFGMLFTYTKDMETGLTRGTLSARGARGRLSTRGDF